MSTRVAVIGAGPSGLSQLNSFQQAQAKGAEIPEIVCFEKQSNWGGLWNFTWRTGLGEHGEPVHSGMYHYLWSNGPKECLEFADYAFDEHFGQPIPSFPPRQVLADYISGRAEKSGVRHWVRFSTVVRDVNFADGYFAVTVEELPSHTRSTERFDYVIVCTGHFSVPNVPEFNGIRDFPGRVMHAHDFREALEFKGKDILIVGASYSAEDIALQSHKYGARSLTMCWRTQPMGFQWPDGMDERPLLTTIDGKTVHFKDGSSKDFDAIILCTGYQHHFPFLEDSLKLRTHNRLFPPGLYKGVAWIENPQLMYLGMQDQFYTFSMFDAQAWWARDVIMGRIELPERDEQSRDAHQWVKREEALSNPHQMIDFQADYVRDLVAVTDYATFDIDLTVDAFYQWEHDKEHDITTYRDKAFKSAVTGTVAPVHHTPWMQAMDDSLKAFLAR